MLGAADFFKWAVHLFVLGAQLLQLVLQQKGHLLVQPNALLLAVGE